MTRRTFTDDDVRRMRELAHAGRSQRQIAEALECSESSVARRAGGINPRGGAKPDLKRRARVLKALDAVPPGERGDLPGRFGLANMNSLNTLVCRWRKAARVSVTSPPDTEVTRG